MTAQAEVEVNVGPGTELKRIFSRLFITATPECLCTQRAELMDTMGADWCRDNRRYILGWLREEAISRGIPFVETIANHIIERAIKRAERASQ